MKNSRIKKDTTIKTLETDYLVIGSGAVGMAFVDTMLDESDANFIIVDRHHMPGGHWNDAYPFVRLHQPSAFYGVASTELGSMRIDEAGPNKGLYELASGAEVSAYFDNVMRERFLPSGRVRYFPMCEYKGQHQFRSLLSEAEYEVTVNRKTVDGTFFNTSVPSTHARQYAVDEDVECVAPNDLPRRAPEYARFTILGGGKTGMDVIVWLLEAGADPDSITWVCPRDSWLLNRETTQPGTAFWQSSLGGAAAQLEAMRQATSIDNLFERLESAGYLLRIDPDVAPQMMHYATISHGEVAQLRSVKNVVRRGHVERVASDRLLMANGDTIAAESNTLYIDCTATAVQFVGSKTVPVFSGNHITLQAIRAPLVATSAAMTAYVEAHLEDETEKNQLCTPIELSDTPAEWLNSVLCNMISQGRWSKDDQIREWFARCRLNPARPMPDDQKITDPEFFALRQRIGESAKPAVGNLQKLLAMAGGAPPA